MLASRLRFLPALVALLIAPLSVHGQATLPPGFQDQLVVGGLSTPSGIAFLPDGRCLVTEQRTARLRLIVNGALSATDPVCTVPNVRTDNYFRGVYGAAFDPRWPSSPYLYVHYNSQSPGRVMLSRFTVAGDLAFTGNGALTINPSSRYDLFTDINDAAHNGGTLRFGADQMLYASVGDSFTVPCAAQRIASMRGVLLRLEIRNLPPGSGGPPAKTLLAPSGNPFPSHPLLWARGFRNPFRFHIDPANGEVFVADVGESEWEEIDRVAAGGGTNFGWPIREGPDPYSSCPGAPDLGLTVPIYAYGNGAAQCVIGAGLYRRPASGTYRFPPEYDGDYFFSDLFTGALRRLEGSGTSWSIAPPVAGQPEPSSWATGLAEVTDYLRAGDGSLWYCRQSVDGAENTGSIRRIVYVGPADVSDAPAAGNGIIAVHPMPARGAVTLEYRLPEAARVEIDIVEASGRRVRMLEPGADRAAGSHRIRWDGRRPDGAPVASGLYFARLRAAHSTWVRRIVVVH